MRRFFASILTLSLGAASVALAQDDPLAPFSVVIRVVRLVGVDEGEVVAAQIPLREQRIEGFDSTLAGEMR